MKIDKDVKRYLIDKDATILEAMKNINEGKDRTGFQIDSNNRLVRAITDGDLRRAILNNFNLNDKVSSIHDNTPYVIKEDQGIDEAKKYLSTRIAVIPIVDNNNIIKGIIRLQDVQPFINISSRTVMIFGLGYVGLTLGMVLADNGFHVIGFDKNKILLDKLNNKIPPFYEAGLKSYIYKYVGENFKVTSSIDQAIADIYIISVGTPIDKESNEPNMSAIKSASKSIGKILKRNDLVILRSTIPMGTTRKVVLPCLESESGLKGGKDFYLAFCPERTAEGKALEELRLNPQIIGGLDNKSTELASRFFNEYTHTVIDVGSLEGAEISKLIDNTFRDTIFAYSNQMANLCEKAGLNLNEIIEKVNLGYQRNIIPKPSPGVGGPCLSKDPYILMKNFQEYDIESPLTQATRIINEQSHKNIYKRSENLLNSVDKSITKAKIFILGFAFKGDPETSDLRESTTIWFLEELKKNGVENIFGYDAIVEKADLESLNVNYCSIKEGFKNADAVFIMNNHQSYANIPIFKYIDLMNSPALFYDAWQTYPVSDLNSIPGIIYAGVGVG